MPDLDDYDDGFGVVDRIENAVVPLAKAELLLAGEFLTTRWARVVCKALDFDDSTETIEGLSSNKTLLKNVKIKDRDYALLYLEKDIVATNIRIDPRPTRPIA